MICPDCYKGHEKEAMRAKLEAVRALAEKWKACAARSRADGESCDCEDFAPDLLRALDDAHEGNTGV